MSDKSKKVPAKSAGVSFLGADVSAYAAMAAPEAAKEVAAHKVPRARRKVGEEKPKPGRKPIPEEEKNERDSLSLPASDFALCDDLVDALELIGAKANRSVVVRMATRIVEPSKLDLNILRDLTVRDTVNDPIRTAGYSAEWPDMARLIRLRRELRDHARNMTSPFVIRIGLRLIPTGGKKLAEAYALLISKWKHDPKDAEAAELMRLTK